jgi:hypothetical protein
VIALRPRADGRAPLVLRTRDIENRTFDASFPIGDTQPPSSNCSTPAARGGSTRSIIGEQ